MRGVLMLRPIEFHQLLQPLIQQHLHSSYADISQPDACWILLSPIWKGKPLIRSVICLSFIFCHRQRLLEIMNHWLTLDKMLRGKTRSRPRDSKGISKLPKIQLILPYKISCIGVSSEIPLLSLAVLEVVQRSHYTISAHPVTGSAQLLKVK